MRNKYKYGELVVISGKGKIYGKVKNKLGIIIEKDDFYNDYYINLFLGKKDWFNEKELKSAFNEKKNKIPKFDIRLVLIKKGYEILKKALKDNEPISNDKFKKVSFKKKFIKDKKEYIILGWDNVFWPATNKSIKLLEKTIKKFRKLDIAFQYIVLNKDELEDVRIYEFIENDKNVDVFEVKTIIIKKCGG